MKKLLIATLAVALAGVGINSYAAPATDNFTVTATVTANCSVVAADLSFSGIDVRAESTQQSNIEVTCTNQTAYVIGLSAGVSTDVAARTMKDGSKVLNYFLYQDAAHTLNWTNEATAPGGKAGTGTGSNQDITVYGVVPIQSSAQAGTGYTDSITATVNF